MVGEKIQLPLLDPLARETSFRELYTIKRVYSKILGMDHIDHFSINVVPKNNQMLVFSMRPEMAYTLYSTRQGIEQDLAISPTFYTNLNFYFWDDCYNISTKQNLMAKKEKRFGIKAGAVIVYEHNETKYLLSFGTKTKEDNFRQNMTINRDYFKSIGVDCLYELQDTIGKYINRNMVQTDNVIAFSMKSTYAIKN